MGSQNSAEGQATAPAAAPASPTAPGPAAAPTNAELAGRLDTLAGAVDRIAAALQGGERTAQAGAQQGRERELDAPTAIADQVRSELDKARAAEQQQAAADGAVSRFAALEQQIKDMAEKMPAGPQRKIERIWG